MPYIQVFRKYADFTGRATRSEFWWFYLGHFILGFVFGFIDNGVFPDLPLEQRPVMSVYLLVTLLPALAVGARRLHDTGKSGWLQAVVYIPWAATATLPWFFEQIGLITLMLSILGFLVLAFFTMHSGDTDENKYGSPVS